MNFFRAISMRDCRLLTCVEDFASYFYDQGDSYVHLWNEICNLNRLLCAAEDYQRAGDLFTEAGWDSFLWPADAGGPFPRVYWTTWVDHAPSNVYCYGFAGRRQGVVFPPDAVPAGAYHAAHHNWAHSARNAHRALQR